MKIRCISKQNQEALAMKGTLLARGSGTPLYSLLVAVWKRMRPINAKFLMLAGIRWYIENEWWWKPIHEVTYGGRRGGRLAAGQ
jgi:hypothetical protein